MGHQSAAVTDCRLWEPWPEEWTNCRSEKEQERKNSALRIAILMASVEKLLDSFEGWVGVQNIISKNNS